MLRRITVLLALSLALVTVPLINSPEAEAAAINVSAARAHDIRLKVNQYVEIQVAQRAPYCRRGTGPVCFDCSGLVVAAYRWAGIRLPVRRSIDMRRWSTPTSLKYARTGDLLFYSGHVEMVYKKNGTGPALAMAAHTYGTPVKITQIRRTGLLKVGKAIR